jgi:hypothetical protein
MRVPKTVAAVLRNHGTREVAGLDRLDRNVDVPQRQREVGVVGFRRNHRGHRFAASALLAPRSAAFLQAIADVTDAHAIPVLPVANGQRTDAGAAEHRARFSQPEGVLVVGTAQEKTPVVRTENRKHPTTGQSYPWIVRSTALVNPYDCDGVDEDFGPFFLKFGSYFPSNAKLCRNGHAYRKRPLAKEGIAVAALDNGLLSWNDPQRLPQSAHGLDAAQIDALRRTGRTRRPHPFTAADRPAGYRYDVAVLQAEFSRTQVLDRPLPGRIVFAEVLRENLDIGRPDRVQLLVGRRVTKRTPGRFRTRVLTEGVTPTVPVDDKKARIKQYHKEGRAVRTATTINDTRDFGIGTRLCNLPAWRAVGFQANRRLLDVHTISQDSAVGEALFRQVTQPREVNGQRAAALRYGAAGVLALWSALLGFRLLPRGVRNRELREHLAPLLGDDPSALTQGRRTYQLRRLRVHGVIGRQVGTPR